MKEFISRLDNYNTLKGSDKEVVKGIFKVYENVDGFVYPKVDGFPSIDDKHKAKVVAGAMADLKDYIVEIANEYINSKIEVKEEIKAED